MTLDIDAVTVRFRDGSEHVEAVKGVSLSVAAGELLALTGPSGSGKSTLLAVAGLLLTPDEGTIRIMGSDGSGLAPRRRHRLRRDHVAFVFQDANLVPSLSALQQLLLVARLRGVRPGPATERARSLLDQVGMTHAERRRPDQLSGGERQRVGIARALMTDPDVLLVDEPTAALDRSRGGEVLELLASMTRQRGCATLLVTHEVALAERFADRVAVLVDGVLEGAGVSRSG